jgi:two-component sensor histidine kinase
LIWVRVQTEEDAIVISIGDEGVGLPPGFDPAASKRLGTRLVNALSNQLGGELTRSPTPIGTNFTLHIPLRSWTPRVYSRFSAVTADQSSVVTHASLQKHR